VRTRLFVLTALAAGAVAFVATAPVAASQRGTRATVIVRSSNYGRVLWTGSRRPLYAFTRDPRRRSTCYGACAKAWPPYIVHGSLRAGTGAKSSLLSTIRRRNGSRQVTYAGRPLYRYVDDPVGSILCQNVREFGGLWRVMRPSGRLVR